VVEPDVIDHIDLVIDGVDQINSRKQAIKGGGGALVREKILAEAAEQVIWIMDAGKRVETIEDYTLPIELVPFSHPFVRRTLTNRGYDAILRMQQDSAFITDNGNLILDVRIPASRPIQELVHIAGVVETGYFHMEAMCITAETTGVTIW
jgi:ribose 5-phosphate isomerase A